MLAVCGRHKTLQVVLITTRPDQIWTADGNRPHYYHPGDGHHEGETLRQTAAREVKEETGAGVEVGCLLFTAESVPFEVEYAYGSTYYLKLIF